MSNFKISELSIVQSVDVSLNDIIPLQHQGSNTITHTTTLSTIFDTFPIHDAKVEQTLTTGAEIGKINGTALYAPAMSTNYVSFDEIYPVGSIYLSLSETLPTTFQGVWEPIASGMCLWGAKVDGGDVGTYKTAGLPLPTASSTDSGHQHNYNEAFNDNRYWSAQSGNSLWAFVRQQTTTSGKANITTTINEDEYYKSTNTTVQPPALVVRMWMRRS